MMKVADFEVGDKVKVLQRYIHGGGADDYIRAGDLGRVVEIGRYVIAEINRMYGPRIMYYFTPDEIERVDEHE